MIKKGSFVRIEKIILNASERTSKIPDDTKANPFKMWTKGILQEDCAIGESASIITNANREENGILVEVNPMYDLNYGEFLNEMVEIDRGIKNER